MNIIQKPSPNFGSRRGYSPELLVVHIMDGSLSGTDQWFATTASQVSSHYGVGLNGEVHQYVQDKDEAWTEGNVRGATAKLLKPNVNPNYYCLSVENEGHDLSKAPDTQLNALAELLHSLAVKYSISIDRQHIIGHYEIDSVVKGNCPSPDHTFMDKLVQKVVLLNNVNKKTMPTKYIRFYTTGNDVVNTYNVENNAVESVGETHAFTSAEDAQAKSEKEVFIFWDGLPMGAGLV